MLASIGELTSTPICQPTYIPANLIYSIHYSRQWTGIRLCDVLTLQKSVQGQKVWSGLLTKTQGEAQLELEGRAMLCSSMYFTSDSKRACLSCEKSLANWHRFVNFNIVQPKVSTQGSAWKNNEGKDKIWLAPSCCGQVYVLLPWHCTAALHGHQLPKRNFSGKTKLFFFYLNTKHFCKNIYLFYFIIFYFLFYTEYVATRA